MFLVLHQSLLFCCIAFFKLPFYHTAMDRYAQTSKILIFQFPILSRRRLETISFFNIYFDYYCFAWYWFNLNIPNSITTVCVPVVTAPNNACPFDSDLKY